MADTKSSSRWQDYLRRAAPYQGLAILVLITLFTGLVQGRLTNRWGIPRDMLQAVGRVEDLKEVLKTEGFGGWRLVEEKGMSDVVIDTLECEAFINGTFVNEADRSQVINGFIVLGPPGPISVHTPEVCYDSRGYDKGEPEAVSLDGKNGFWGLTLTDDGDLERSLLRVYYAWGNDGQWTASGEPRVTYGRDSYLFKIQLAAKMPSGVDLSKRDFCRDFLTALVPVANPILFAEDE